MPYYLAIDQGSQSSRALLFDADGEQLAAMQRPVELYRGNASHVEHDPAQLLESVVAAVDELLNAQPESVRNAIAACGLATQRSSVLAWNDSGEALSPILSWQDVRGAPQVETLRAHAARIQAITGLPLSAYYGASKLHWLLTHEPAVRQCQPNRLRLSPLVSYLLYHLVEDAAYLVDHSNAQRTQLMDISTLDWSEPLLSMYGLERRQLPECHAMCADYGLIRNTSIPLKAVCGDQNAAIYGVGELPQDTALINIGSGAFVMRVMSCLSTGGRQLTGIACTGADGIRYCREATINGAGSALRWLTAHYGVADIEQNLSSWLATVESPPLFINTVGGLGSPWWRQDLEPEFIGTDNSYGHAALTVAVIESILFMLRANIELMQQDFSLSRLRVSGGLSSSDAVCQKLANLCSLPVERVHNKEATARGVAWLAAGQPLHWRQLEAPELFVPELETGLNQRYTQYMDSLNRFMEN